MHLNNEVAELFALILLLFKSVKHLIQLFLCQKSFLDQMFTDRYVLHIRILHSSRLDFF